MRPVLLSLLLVACEAGGAITIPEGGVVEDTDTDIDTDTDTDVEPEPDPEPDCVPFGFSVDDRLSIDHGSVIVGHDPEAPQDDPPPTSVSINSAEDCALDLRQGAIGGDVHVGPSGYPDVVLCLGRSATVTGRQGILDARVALSAAPLPGDLPANGGDKLMEWGEEATFTVDRVFDSLRVRTRARLVIDGDVDIHVHETLEINNGIVDLTPGSALRLWVGSDAQVIWRSEVNVAGDPAAFELHLRDGASLELNHGSRVAAQVWAPGSAVLIEGRDTALRGTVQADEAALAWGARVHVPGELVCP